MDSKGHRTDENTIGLALSGGGSRAIAFHLGCMRALDDLHLLNRVKVISSVSGGSVIGAAWAIHQGDFASFEQSIRKVLKTGLATTAFKQLFTPLGVKVIGSFVITSSVAIFLLCLRWLAKALSIVLPFLRPFQQRLAGARSPVRRAYSRTSLLEAAMAKLLFGDTTIEGLASNSLKLIVNATELRTGSAFRYSSAESSSWRWGKLLDNNVPLAHAVAASAAYPMFLPAFDEYRRFVDKAGNETEQRILLTDGGVYDNLGLGVFWPNRISSVSYNVHHVDSIICCSAGYGLKLDQPHSFMLARLNSTVATIFERVQSHSMARLHELKEAGVIQAFILPYLGQQDAALPQVIPNLVPREEVHAYPTDFNAMSTHWIDRISLRGEQLTRTLAQHYFPEMVS